MRLCFVFSLSGISRGKVRNLEIPGIFLKKLLPPPGCFFSGIAQFQEKGKGYCFFNLTKRKVKALSSCQKITRVPEQEPSEQLAGRARAVQVEVMYSPKPGNWPSLYEQY